MPYINIKITREGATAEQKAELIKGATELLARVLNKNPKTTVVTIEEVDTDSWGIGGDPVEIARENEKLRVAEIEKLKVDKDALERKLAEVKDILLTFPDDEPPVFTLDNNALKLKKGKKSNMSIDISSRFNYEQLFRFVLPSVVMMIFISTYTMVDGFFVSNYVGKTAFTAVNLIFPAIMVFACVGFMFGAGGSALVAKTMGEGQMEKANRLFSLIVLSALAGGILLSALGYFLMPFLAAAMGASGEVLACSVFYGRTLLLSLPMFVLQRVFQSFMVTAGKPSLGLRMTILSGVTNIGLDALFILVFKWGLLGAGLATVLCEYAGGLFPLIYFLKRNTSSLQLVNPEWDGSALWKACTNGSSELLTNISMSFVSMLYNYQLISIAGTDGVAAFGVIMYVAFFFEAIYIGYSMGTAPIVSYNYGARRDDELRSIFRKSLTVIAGTGLFLTTSAYLAAPVLADIFVGYDETLATLTVRGFRFFSFSFLLNGFCMYGSAFFTALNNGFISSVISLLQSVVFQIIAVIALPLWLGTDGIWLSVSIAKLLACFVTVSFWISCRKEYRYV